MHAFVVFLRHTLPYNHFSFYFYNIFIQHSTFPIVWPSLHQGPLTSLLLFLEAACDCENLRDQLPLSSSLDLSIVYLLHRPLSSALIIVIVSLRQERGRPASVFIACHKHTQTHTRTPPHTVRGRNNIFLESFLNFADGKTCHYFLPNRFFLEVKLLPVFGARPTVCYRACHQ